MNDSQPPSRPGAQLSLVVALAAAAACFIAILVGYGVQIQDGVASAKVALVQLVVVFGGALACVLSAQSQRHEQPQEQRSFAQLLGAVQRASAGDLTVAVVAPEASEAAHPLELRLEDLLASLRELVRTMQQLGVAVKGASTQLAASTTQHEAIVSEQAATSNQLAATVGEISATSQQLSQSVSSVSDSARAMASHAGSCQRDLEGVLSGLKQTEATSQRVGTQLGALEETTSRIAQVTEAMMQLAAQANLLSLNAAIEAEKAGEAGRGFSIVALEIRRLADQTAASASEIEGSLGTIRTSTSSTVTMVGDFLHRVKGDAQRVDEVGSRVAEILQQVQTVSEQIEMVEQATQSQAQGARFALDGLQQLSEAIQQTLGSVRDTVATAQKLEKISTTIHSTASRYTVPSGVKRPSGRRSAGPSTTPDEPSDEV